MLCYVVNNNIKNIAGLGEATNSQKTFVMPPRWQQPWQEARFGVCLSILPYMLTSVPFSEMNIVGTPRGISSSLVETFNSRMSWLDFDVQISRSLWPLAQSVNTISQECLERILGDSCCSMWWSSLPVICKNRLEVKTAWTIYPDGKNHPKSFT